MSKRRAFFYIYIGISICLFGGYYYCTIAANSFSGDQYTMIEQTKEILEGNLRLVGMRTSRLQWNFPIINYLLTPLIAITSNAWVLYVSTSVTYVLGIWSLSWILLKYRPFSEFLIFASLSLTHVWSLFYSSFAWPPNYIPFFLSLFFICFFHYLRNSENVWFFHGASLFLNIAFQLHTMSVVLIFGFVLALTMLGKLPRYRHWFLQVGLQIFLISPWIIFHLFVIDWGKEPEYHSSLFKHFFSPAQAFMNYLSGTGLTREFSQYLTYGTNTFPHEKFWFTWLSIGGWVFLLLLIWALWNGHKLLNSNDINWIKIRYHLLPYYHEETDINRAYPVAVYCLFLPVLLYQFSGIYMEPHYFQFLTPLMFLLVATLPGQIKHPTKRKIAWSCILVIVIIQGSFSYWRAAEEHRSPYLDDIGYTQVLAKVVAEQCKDNPQIRFVSNRGFRDAGKWFHFRFDPELAEFDRTGTLHCKLLLAFQNKLLEKSPIVNWHLRLLKPVLKLEVHNNQIWIMGDQ